MSSPPLRLYLARLESDETARPRAHRRSLNRVHSIRDGRRILLLTPTYIAVLAAGELLCGYLAPAFAPIYYVAALLLLLLHAGLFWDRPFHYIPLTLATAPIARLALLLLGPAGQPDLYRYLALGIPALAAVIIAWRILFHPWLKTALVVCLLLLVVPLGAVLVYV